MALPEYWWLLALACAGQGLFFLRPGALRATPARHPAWALAGLYGGGCAGLAYGLVQSDPLLLVGQAVVLAAVALGRRPRAGKENERDRDA